MTDLSFHGPVDENVAVACAAEPKARTSRSLLLPFMKGTVALARAIEWVFGVLSLILGLSILAAIPVVQFLSMGYLLESSARVARRGSLRDGLIGVRKAARVGGLVAGTWLSLVPVWIVRSLARSAEVIDPDGPVARKWQVGLVLLSCLIFLHLGFCVLRGGRLRYFLWPVGHLFWIARRMGRRGHYAEVRDALWNFVAGLRLTYFWRMGFVGFLGTLPWVIVPALLIASGQTYPILGVIGVILLALIVPFLPFMQVRFALEGRLRAMFAPRAIRDLFKRAPWAFAFSLSSVLVAAIPLYLLKLEMIPREAAWLPGLVFVIFLGPARLLTGWAYSRAGRREQPRHWLFRIVGRLAIAPVAILYVLVVFLAQYTSWSGVNSLFEQHAFLLPVPFLDM